MVAGESCRKLLLGKSHKVHTKEFNITRKKRSEVDKGTRGDFIAKKQILAVEQKFK